MFVEPASFSFFFCFFCCGIFLGIRPNIYDSEITFQIHWWREEEIEGVTEKGYLFVCCTVSCVQFSYRHRIGALLARLFRIELALGEGGGWILQDMYEMPIKRNLMMSWREERRERREEEMGGVVH